MEENERLTEARIRRAHAALLAYAQESGQAGQTPEDPREWDSICLGEVAGDLITDTLHLAKILDFNPDELIRRGRSHFEAEGR